MSLFVSKAEMDDRETEIEIGIKILEPKIYGRSLVSITLTKHDDDDGDETIRFVVSPIAARWMAEVFALLGTDGED